MVVYKLTEDSLVSSKFNAFLHDDKNKYWLILTPDEFKKDIQYFDFNQQTIYDCMNNKDTPKLEIYENYSFGILNIIGENENFFDIFELDFYMTNKCLIFISNHNFKITDEIKKSILTKGAFSISLEKILYSLFDKLTTQDYQTLENLEMEISDVEEDVVQGKTKDYFKDTVLLKKKLLFLKRHYEPLLNIIEDFTENENNLLDESTIRYFTILFNRIERLSRRVENLRDYVTQIRESYQSQLDRNTNNIMKLFTIITAVFSPLMLITGWYGMNFVHMPELHWKYGYIFVVSLSIIVVFLCIFLFKKKKLM